MKYLTKGTIRLLTSGALIETFRLEDENDYEYDIWLKISWRILNTWTPRKASFYFFSAEKLALFFVEGI